MNLDEVDLIADEDLDPISEQEDSSLYQEPINVEDNYSSSSVTSGEGVSPEYSGNNRSNNDKDILSDYLKFNGIKDTEHIKFEDEDGIVKEKSWNDLSYEEKMNILTTSYQQPERDLDDKEIALLNEIRSRNITPDQYLNIIKQQAAQDYAESLQNAPQFKVDDLSDDEIFILDFQDKIEDATDEEILASLEKAKEDPLFAKRIAGMRTELQNREQAYFQQQEAEQRAQQEVQFNQFRDSVVNSIQSFNKVGDLDINLENDDKEDIASFILDRDDTGMSYMGKALNDPHTLVEMAWWALKGRDAINSISEYFANEIKNVRQMSYQKGLEDGKKNSSRVVYRP